MRRSGSDLVRDADFVALREERDKTLGMPKLIVPSLQVDMRAGHLPEPYETAFNAGKMKERAALQ